MAVLLWGATNDENVTWVIPDDTWMMPSLKTVTAISIGAAVGGAAWVTVSNHLHDDADFMALGLGLGAGMAGRFWPTRDWLVLSSIAMALTLTFMVLSLTVICHLAHQWPMPEPGIGEFGYGPLYLDLRQLTLWEYYVSKATSIDSFFLIGTIAVAGLIPIIRRSPRDRKPMPSPNSGP